MCFFFFKQKTAYEMRISDWSSDVCSSDLASVRARSGGVWIVIIGKVRDRAETQPEIAQAGDRGFAMGDESLAIFDAPHPGGKKIDIGEGIIIAIQQAPRSQITLWREPALEIGRASRRE